MISKLAYPETRRGDTVDTLHGHRVPDPYRWLEDPDSPDTVAWVDKQNAVTTQYLSAADSFKPQFSKTIETLLNYDQYSAGWKRGPYFYYYHHVGISQPQAILMQSDSVDGEPRVFLDPNKMSSEGTVSLATLRWPHNGQLVAYGVHRAGSDWEEIRVMDCNTLKVLPDLIEWAKFTSVAWTHDAKGFYYTRYPKPKSLEADHDVDKRGAETDLTANQSVYYHLVGTPQSEDRLVYSDASKPKRMYGLDVSKDGNFLFMYINEDCSPKNEFWYVDLSKNMGNEAEGIVKLIGAEYDSQFSYLANDERVVYILTNWKAPNNRIIRMSFDDKPEDCVEIVSEHPKNVLSSATVVNLDQMAMVYMEDAHDKLSIHSLKSGSKLYDIKLPDIGSVSVSGDREHDFLMYKFSSFLYAGTIYYVDLTHPGDDGTRIFRTMDPPGFDPAKYKTTQSFYTSKDGKTQVPIFIIGPREESDASLQKRPCLLYGYGGFMISLTPYYSARWAAWMQCLGGIVAIANIRGGAEYGTRWHEEGILNRKQNVFDDFQWAARYLCNDLQVTEPAKLLIMGGSNGGLLVGACVNQAPELYGAAVAQVGVHDIFRFHKFTIGEAWTSDFGHPDKPDHFEFQRHFSPLHNVFSPDERGVPYPAVLLTTADHDDRVVPLHTLKYGAELQYKAGKSNLQEGKPLLMRIDVNAGHGAGKPITKVMEELCDTLLFAALALNVDVDAVSR